MASSFSFDGSIISIPGAYSTIKGGITSPALQLGFSNTLLISTGNSKFFGGGSGINGVLKSGKDSLYTFAQLGEFRKFQRGGLHWFLAGPLFLPGGGATRGIDSLTYVRAATTIPAEIDLFFGSSASDGDENDGSISIYVNDEGFCGNGVLGDEIRAKATITITNAGSAGDEIAISINGNSAGTYVVQAGNNIAAVVAGLSSAININGLCEVFSQSATQIVIYAPHGSATDLNGFPATVSTTGSAGGNSGNFSGGVEGTLLTRGYAAIMTSGVNDTNKFILKFYRGTYKGLDGIISMDAPESFDAIPELSTKPELIVKSPEITSVQELVDWMNSDFTFKFFFTIKNYSIASLDQITVDDLAAYSVYEKAKSGSETYSSDDLTDTLEAIVDLTYDFILADDWGDNARSISNLSIIDFVTNEFEIKPDIYIGGGYDISEWNNGSNSSNSLAVAFDSQYVTLVHGGVKKIAIGGQGFKSYDSIYKAAALLGREGGLAPQIPLTFKNVGIEGEAHALKKKDLELGLQNGVLMTRAFGNSFEVVKGINTLQNNTLLVNPDGSTYSKQLGRIERQLNKELVFNAKTQLFKKSDGTNRNTLKAEDVKSFVEKYLDSKSVKDGKDNLIITFRNVNVVLNKDAYEITYAFVANTEISFLFFSGVILDPNNN